MGEFKVIVAGGRTFNNYFLLKSKLDIILKDIKEEIIIVSGTASGADKLGEKYAQERNYKMEAYPADWSNLDVEPCVIGYNKSGNPYNKLAGLNRNLVMINVAQAAVYFWDNKSTGTKHCIDNAKIKGLKVRVIKY